MLSFTVRGEHQTSDALVVTRDRVKDLAIVKVYHVDRLVRSCRQQEGCPAVKLNLFHLGIVGRATWEHSTFLEGDGLERGGIG